jgi:DNA-binding MarR family transcriptional regulator
MKDHARAAEATPLSKDRLRLWLRLLKAQNVIEAELRRRFRAEFDTTLPRFDVMSALARHPEGLRMSDLSGLLKVSNGNVTGIVERLVEDGLARRDAVPGDRRAQRAVLTATGKHAFAEQAAAHEVWLDMLLRGLDAPAIAALSRGLDTLTDGLETTDAH